MANRCTGEPHSSICGSFFDFNEVRELATISRRQHLAAAELVGGASLGGTPTSKALRAQGRRWAQHVLEGPYTWLLGLLYISLTVRSQPTLHRRPNCRPLELRLLGSAGHSLI